MAKDCRLFSNSCIDFKPCRVPEYYPSNVNTSCLGKRYYLRGNLFSLLSYKCLKPLTIVDF